MDSVNAFTVGKRIRKRMWERFMEENKNDVESRAPDDWSNRTITEYSIYKSIHSSDIAAIDDIVDEVEIEEDLKLINKHSELIAKKK